MRENSKGTNTDTERVLDQRSTRRRSQDQLSICCRAEREVNQTLKIAKESLENSQVRYKKYFDEEAKDRSFQPDDQVLFLLPTNNHKLVLWKGPYNLEKVVNKNDYAIKIGAKSKVYNANL